MPPKITRKQAKLMTGVYRGYIPPDLPQNRPPNRIKPWWKVIGKPYLTLYPRPEVEEWSEEPEYPPINDATKQGLRRQYRLDWYDTLKTKPSVDQKMYEINNKASQKMAHINNWIPTASSLPFVKYLTQTHIINSLPVGYEVRTSRDDQISESNQVSSTDNTIKRIVLDQVALGKYESAIKEGRYFISKQVRDKSRKAHVSNRLIEQIANQLRKVLVYETNPQLLDYQMDLSPAIRSWWYHSGFEPCDKKPFFRDKIDDDGNVNTIFQMDGSSALNIRSEHMMEPIVDINDTLVTDTSLVEKCNYDPKYYGSIYKFKWPVALPGFWFEDTPKYDFPHTCFLSTDCLELRKDNPDYLGNQFIGDSEQCLTGQAILTAFGWLNSLSMYHGYTPFNELHYPFTCQVITTDGQNWMFNVFQLNSHTFHRDLGGPKRNNICWSSGPMKLYEEYRGGNFHGVNDDVIKLLVKFMSTQTSPDYTSQLNLRPYISDDDRSQEEKDEERKKLRRTLVGTKNRWWSNNWQVPTWEHIFFNSKVMRHQIRHMKPKWKMPKPKWPKEFD